ncbi:MAG: NUDIX domain-containing protein [Actinobacteria bacterium]|nr:NUDIX domain-containing protein [Actinomycetota bacterium]
MLIRLRRRIRAALVERAPMWLRYLYPTPKLDVRAVVFRRDELLLVREAGDGRWSLPGGWVDLRESLGEAATREVREESGYQVRPVKLLAVSNINRRRDGRSMQVNVFRLFVRCELASTSARSIQGAETTEAGFFAQSNLPELSPGRCTPAEMRRIFEHYGEPERAADFD